MELSTLHRAQSANPPAVAANKPTRASSLCAGQVKVSERGTKSVRCDDGQGWVTELCRACGLSRYDARFAHASGRRESEENTKTDRQALSFVWDTFRYKEARPWSMGIFKLKHMNRALENGGHLSATQIGQRFAWAVHASLSSLHPANRRRTML